MKTLTTLLATLGLGFGIACSQQHQAEGSLRKENSELRQRQIQLLQSTIGERQSSDLAMAKVLELLQDLQKTAPKKDQERISLGIEAVKRIQEKDAELNTVQKRMIELQGAEQAASQK